jgi:hypothetical protein
MHKSVKNIFYCDFWIIIGLKYWKQQLLVDTKTEAYPLVVDFHFQKADNSAVHW